MKERYIEMDFATLSQLIGSLGFPIVACCAMFYRMSVQDEAHKAEVDKLTEAINNNTIALTKLVQKIGENNEAE